MEKPLNCLLASKEGGTVFIHLNETYAYVYSSEFHSLMGTHFYRDTISSAWCIVAEEPLIQWSEE